MKPKYIWIKSHIQIILFNLFILLFYHRKLNLVLCHLR